MFLTLWLEDVFFGNTSFLISGEISLNTLYHLSCNCLFYYLVYDYEGSTPEDNR